jgi:hypothetical protein
MQNGAGDGWRCRAFEQVSSPSMMQSVDGVKATFKAGLMSMTLGGQLRNPFGFYIDVRKCAAAATSAARRGV